MIKRLLTPLGLVAVAGCDRGDEGAVVGEDGSRVVYTDPSGRVIKLDDLGKVDGKFKWEVVGGNPIPPKAKELHDRARSLGGRGDLEGAVRLLKEAVGLAPDWSYPPYDLAYTYLLMGKSEEALELYAKVDQLEPRGFFTAKTALWALHKEKAGTFPPGTYQAYLKIEWAESDGEKLTLARKLLETAPDYPLALKACALHGEDAKSKTELLERTLKLNPDAETYGLLMVNKAARLNNDGQRPEAIKILGDLILSPDSTLGTVAMAKSVMRLVLQKKP